MKLQISYPLTKRIREEKTFRTPKNILLQILIFVGIFFIAEMAESMGMIAGVMPRFMDWATQQMENNGQIDSQEATDYLNNLTLDPSNTVIMLFSTVLATIVVLLFCRFVEGRKFRTMGFRKKHGFLQYLGGLAAGFVMFSAVVGLSCLMGGLHFEGFQGASAVSIVIVFIGYGLQGMSEEVICRGYLMTTIIRRHSVLTAVLLNGAVFGFLHVFNDGFSALAFLNLTLYGVMISLYILRTDNLWGACAIHSIWNFVQGNFYGLPVSGIDSGDTIFSFSLQSGADLANGGTFGLEAGLPTTIVMTAVILVLLFVPFGRKQEVQSAQGAEA